MSDITMCDKYNCQARKSCARYIQHPARGQSMFFNHPEENQYGSCVHFLPNDNKPEPNLYASVFVDSDGYEHIEMWSAV